VRRFAVLDDVGENTWTTVTVGRDHSCGLKAGGVAFCWGSNQSGQLGTAATDTICGATDASYACWRVPTAVQTSLRWRSISAGGSHTCGITDAGEAYCWGGNDQGQLGDASRGGPALVRIVTSLTWTQISAGFNHTCAIRSDGVLFCWGSNDRGQAGNGSIGPVTSPVRAQMPTPVASASAGQQRTCGRTTVGTVYCWGAIWTKREGGLEFTRSQLTPQLVPDAPQMTRLSVGTLTTCGVDASGFAYCWEANPRGAIGNGTTDGSISPKRISSTLEFVQVAAGLVQTCGVVADGVGYCWGDDSFGELGIHPSLLPERCGSQQLPCTTVPVAVYGRQQFTTISTSFGSHTCGVTVRGNLYCWGLGVSGQRGDGTNIGAQSVPVTVVDP
jgi:alpha-tubulin suppressor-like RCC1 family protein